MLSRFVLSAVKIGRGIPQNARGIFTYPKDCEEEMTITDQGDVIVCWHPEKPFPYECSKRLPAQDHPSDSKYKLESKEKIYEVFAEKKSEFMREELAQITFTTKHRWFPRTGIKKRKKTAMNRPYL